MKRRWTKEEAWKWYEAYPWIRGCNYMSADSANRVDQWQSLGFEERMKTTEEEFRLARETGFNSIRVLIEYVVWKEEHDGFLERFDRYLDLAAKYGLSVMVVLANDGMPAKGPDYKLPYIGEQTYDWGYHGGRKHSPHAVQTEPAPHFYLDDPVTREDYFRMVSEIVRLHRTDERIIVWDVYNEAGHSNRKEISIPNVKRMFELVRAEDPVQPLTACVCPRRDEARELPEIEKICLENSDVISYHFYHNFQRHAEILKHLKAYGRPLFCTEWLCRCFHNNVADLFPLFYMEGIACYNWGFVAGKYQTYEPWELVWTNVENGTYDDVHVDFTKWFHDLYRPNHRPYDPEEIGIIQKYAGLADREFAEKKEEKDLRDQKI